LSRSKRKLPKRNLPGTLSTHLTRYIHKSFIHGNGIEDIASAREITTDRVINTLFSTNIPEDIYKWREHVISESSKMLSNGVLPNEIRAKLNLSYNMFSHINKRYKSLDISIKKGQYVHIIKGDNSGQVGVCTDTFTFTQTEVLPFVEVELSNNRVVKVLSKWCRATKK